MSLSSPNDGALPTEGTFPRLYSPPPIAETTTPSPPAPDVFHLGYRRWLDGLRGVAILLVMAYHVGLLPGGSLGVDVFFVLSGFLITSLLLEEYRTTSAISLKHFYLRRALRLLPAFLTVLVICGLSTLWLPSAAAKWARWQEIAVAACYVANWPNLHRTEMPILRHTWSLSVEEQFYLLWPVLLYGMMRLKLSPQRMLLFTCGGIVASALLRMGLYHWYPNRGSERLTTVLRLYMGLDTRADALLVGCSLAVLAAWNLLPKSRRLVRGMGAAALVSVVGLGYLSYYRTLEHSQYYHGLFTIVAVMTATIIARLLSAPSRLASVVLDSTPLVATGRLSYGLYLFHMPIIYIATPVFTRWGYYPFVAVVLGSSFLIALVSFCLIERPCLRLKDRFRPRYAVNSPRALALPERHVNYGLARTAD